MATNSFSEFNADKWNSRTNIVGTVLPFLAVLIDPSSIWDNHIVQILIAWGKYTKPEELITPITIGFAASAVITAAIRLTNLWQVENGCSDSQILAATHIEILYTNPIQYTENSSEVNTTITSRIAETVSVINSTLRLITAVIVAASLLIGLLISIDNRSNIWIDIRKCIRIDGIFLTKRTSGKQ